MMSVQCANTKFSKSKLKVSLFPKALLIGLKLDVTHISSPFHFTECFFFFLYQALAHSVLPTSLSVSITHAYSE